MSPATLRLVVLVSCAHALVHVYELSLPSLELQIASSYQQEHTPEAKSEGKRKMGLLSNTWRFPFGFGALLAGYLVDRWGSRRMLILYLVGCSGACLVAGFSLPLTGLFATMFTMGAFASIYHPAGLTLISCETETAFRPRALGLHGIFGSAGIASAPFLVGLMAWLGADWQQCYLILAAPGLLLALLLFFQWRNPSEATDSAPKPLTKEQGRWVAFGLLTAVTILQGFVYAGVLSFLTRYLSQSDWVAGAAATSDTGAPLSTANFLSAFVLAMGCIGQYSAGRFAKIERLERQLTQVTACNVPLLLWMAWAVGDQRILAAAAFSTVHFMHQPLYNSLVAQYTPVRQRSFCYGLSFALAFGLGGFGATLVGFSHTDQQAFQTLAGVALLAAVLGLVLVNVTQREMKV